jgi:hypothetical protein
MPDMLRLTIYFQTSVWGDVATVTTDTLWILIIQLTSFRIVPIVAWNQLAQHKSAVSDYLDWGFIGFLIPPGEFWESTRQCWGNLVSAIAKHSALNGWYLHYEWMNTPSKNFAPNLRTTFFIQVVIVAKLGKNILFLYGFQRLIVSAKVTQSTMSWATLIQSYKFIGNFFPMFLNINVPYKYIERGGAV